MSEPGEDRADFLDRVDCPEREGAMVAQLVPESFFARDDNGV